MKTKLRSLLILTLFFASFMVNGQDTIRSLVITEWRGDWVHNSYVELTNMGDVELDLSDFTLALWIGEVSAADIPATRVHRLEGMLPPNESFVIAAYAEGSETWITPVGYPKIHPRILEQADLLVFAVEDAARLAAAGLTLEQDSVSDGFQDLLNVNRGERAHGLFYHTAVDDSVLVDGVGLAFDPGTGKLDMANYKDVAGVTNATETHILVRKFSVKEGNPKWTETRGATPEESQWIPIPFETGWYNRYSGDYTTCGNHADYALNESSLKPLAGVAMDIDFLAKTITLPWGALRDTISLSPWVLFDFGNGMAWDYNLNAVREDSAHAICVTGDIMSIFVVGNELEQVDFTVNVAPPTNDMNEVFPLRTINSDGYYTENQYHQVTQNDPVIDSVTNVAFGLRVDTLLNRLEIAPNASWEMAWLDGLVTADVKFGDKLIVTASSGDKKEYFIAVDDYEPNSNASLAAITWPDIPEYLKGGAGWTGDTIPNFIPEGLVYSVTVPYGVKSVPALVAHPQNTNANISVDRATSLSGSLDDRTTVFTVFAEDGIAKKEYKVVFSKEIIEDWIQPFIAEPFFSQILRHQLFDNYWTEIYNPGNQTLDLSHYMLSMGPNGASPEDFITADPAFADRYVKYVPGYKFSDDPLIYEVDKTLKKDLSVEPKIKPNDVWVYGQFAVREDRKMPSQESVTDFHLSPGVENIWGITYAGIAQVSQHTYRRHPIYLFKIINDTVLAGDKAPNDPKDFELIDVFGRYPNPENIQYDPIPGIPTGNVQGLGCARKETIWKGNDVPGGSFGDLTTTEWDVRWKDIHDPNTTTLDKWDWTSEGLGIHYMAPVTVYKSTIKSTVYLVSDGYANGQTIKGIPAGSSVDAMLAGIIKEDPNQYLKVIATADGSIKTGTDVLVVNDTLLVTSADSANSTTYIMNVGVPLDDNAVITSTVYNVEITNENGVISGMDYGVSIKSVLEKISVPSLATLNIIDQNNELIPLLILNEDTAVVETIITDFIYFEVVAQNGTTIIKYKLSPVSTAASAMVLSNVYAVDQNLFFINFIENNTTVSTFFKNIFPVNGATAVLVDKLGFARTMGYLSFDDELIVTSQDGTVTNTYFLGFKAELDVLGTDAYVVSGEFEVDQIALTISKVPNSYNVNAFKAGITAAPGATFMVADFAGVEKTTGLMIEGDQLIVTSEDGAKTVNYTVSVTTTGINSYASRMFDIYPNPTTGNLYIKGVENGDLIKVLNVVGHELKQIPSNNFDGVISLKEFKSGFYILNIETNKGNIYTYKIFKN
ncbi:MAG: T9SS type A sorting domain-containing protein [Bacteroidales bacterium]|nr:T9SS type A sorting domain-containing protein [Bacteroidales bacterium]MCF8392154.1 T9SS type A sorting domain-containing protein [Bacteroidales bacterium]